MFSGVYQILNLKNGKTYIGSAAYLDKRKSEHFRTLKKAICKLNNLQVSIIRKLSEMGSLKQREIAEIFNIAQCTVSDIKTNRRWRN